MSKKSLRGWLVVAAFCALLLSSFFLSVQPSSAQAPQIQNPQAHSVHGVVVNRVTHEPVGRALVFSPDNRFATMTDAQGHFEFNLAQAEADNRGNGASGLPSLQGFLNGADRPNMLMARKPGFLEDPQHTHDLQPDILAGKELTLTLMPEALIVGRVALPASDESARVQVQLYQREVQDGIAHWFPRQLVTTRSTGEFRFSDLSPGTYKLLTLELLDRDPLTFDPHGQLYGYPPVYFPNAADFATANTIPLSAGESFRADISLLRQPYYPVKIAVLNPPPGPGLRIRVSHGQKGPGYSLGYDANDQTIEGLLPNGMYKVEASSSGANSVAGALTLTVKGAALDGPRMTLVPNGSIRVNVKEEFTGTDHTGSMSLVTRGGRFTLRGPRRYLNIRFQPEDDVGMPSAASPRLPSGPEDNSIVYDDVQPGRYWVRINSSRGFAASVSSGGVDLQHHPLVVGAGSNSPIEVTMRDDFAELDGMIAGVRAPGHTEDPVSYESSSHVYCVPLPDSGGEFRDIPVAPDGKFTSEVPPGVYRVLAFNHPQELEYRNADAMRAYEGKGPVVRLVPGQKEHLSLQSILTSE